MTDFGLCDCCIQQQEEEAPIAEYKLSCGHQMCADCLRDCNDVSHDDNGCLVCYTNQS